MFCGKTEVIASRTVRNIVDEEGAQILDSLTNPMRVLPRACAVLAVLAMQDYIAVVVEDQPAREADQDRRKLVRHGRYVPSICRAP